MTDEKKLCCKVYELHISTDTGISKTVVVDESVLKDPVLREKVIQDAIQDAIKDKPRSMYDNKKVYVDIVDPETKRVLNPDTLQPISYKNVTPDQITKENTSSFVYKVKDTSPRFDHVEVTPDKVYYVYKDEQGNIIKKEGVVVEQKTITQVQQNNTNVNVTASDKIKQSVTKIKKPQNNQQNVGTDNIQINNIDTTNYGYSPYIPQNQPKVQQEKENYIKYHSDEFFKYYKDQLKFFEQHKDDLHKFVNQVTPVGYLVGSGGNPEIDNKFIFYNVWNETNNVPVLGFVSQKLNELSNWIEQQLNNSLPQNFPERERVIGFFAGLPQAVNFYDAGRFMGALFVGHITVKDVWQQLQDPRTQGYVIGANLPLILVGGIKLSKPAGNFFKTVWRGLDVNNLNLENLKPIEYIETSRRIVAPQNNYFKQVYGLPSYIQIIKGNEWELLKALNDVQNKLQPTIQINNIPKNIPDYLKDIYLIEQARRYYFEPTAKGTPVYYENKRMIQEIMKQVILDYANRYHKYRKWLLDPITLKLNDDVIKWIDTRSSVLAHVGASGDEIVKITLQHLRNTELRRYITGSNKELDFSKPEYEIFVNEKLYANSNKEVLVSHPNEDIKTEITKIENIINHQRETEKVQKLNNNQQNKKIITVRDLFPEESEGNGVEVNTISGQSYLVNQEKENIKVASKSYHQNKFINLISNIPLIRNIFKPIFGGNTNVDNKTNETTIQNIDNKQDIKNTQPATETNQKTNQNLNIVTEHTYTWVKPQSLEKNVIIEKLIKDVEQRKQAHDNVVRSVKDKLNEHHEQTNKIMNSLQPLNIIPPIPLPKQKPKVKKVKLKEITPPQRSQQDVFLTPVKKFKSYEFNIKSLDTMFKYPKFDVPKYKSKFKLI